MRRPARSGSTACSESPRCSSTSSSTPTATTRSILSPYLFWTTVVGLDGRPGTHDRDAVPARRAATRDSRCCNPVLSDVASLWFLSEPEHQLAHRLTPAPRAPCRHGRGCARADELRRRRLSARDTASSVRSSCSPAGAKRGKGWDWPPRFVPLRDPRSTDLPFDLVTDRCEPGDMLRSTSPDVSIDLGYLDDAEVANAFAGATCVRAAEHQRELLAHRSWSRGWPAHRCSPRPRATC